MPSSCKEVDKIIVYQTTFCIFQKNKRKNLIDTDDSMVITRGKGAGEVEEGEGR